MCEPVSSRSLTPHLTLLVVLGFSALKLLSCSVWRPSDTPSSDAHHNPILPVTLCVYFSRVFLSHPSHPLSSTVVIEGFSSLPKSRFLVT